MWRRRAWLVTLPLALLACPKPDDPQAALEAAVQRLQDAPKLAELVPPPRAHLIRFHGVFAPNAKLRDRWGQSH